MERSLRVSYKKYFRYFEKPLSGSGTYNKARFINSSGGGLTPSIRRRNNWNDRDCTSRRRLQDNPAPVPADNDDHTPTSHKIEGILKTESVDLKLEENREAHHTDDYEVDDLILRRGQEFEVVVTFNREYNEESDEVKFIFQTGESPRVSKGTEAHAPMVNHLDNKEWGCKKTATNGNEVTYKLMTPSDAIVTSWTMIVQTIFEKKNDKANRYRYKLQDPIFVLFNAWCNGDQCFIANEEEREEYVMTQTGRIWRGSDDSNSGMDWNYKQFDDVCLLGAMHLLDISGLGDTARGNPILVSRTLSQMANSNDNDGGVLSGNWSGNYTGGTAPTTWQGSGSIMEEYMRTKRDVKWAQCWVFSGLLTTLCRTLGIPARSVTNFQSAHDTDGSMTIDSHFNPDGKPMRGGMDDSVWNFHVWNETWFQRPDLPDGYDGWQAIDSTPQEASENLMRCGPAPLIAIKKGDVHLNYDAKFIFAEVNGDRYSWIVYSDGSMKPVQTEEDTVGKQISTKAVGSKQLNDVTNLYKYPEGSREERDAVENALKYSSRKKDLKLDDSKNDCKLKLSMVCAKNADISTMATFINKSDEERTVNLTMTAVASYYTGLTGEELRNLSDTLTLQPNSEDSYEMNIAAVNWINIVDADATVKVFVNAKVEETGQVMTRQKAASVDKPELDVEVSTTTPVVGEEFDVIIKFTNPLDVSVTKGVFSLEGPGAQRSMHVEAQKSIGPGQTVTEKIPLTPSFPGKKEIVVGFNSRQLTGITGSASVRVKRK